MSHHQPHPYKPRNVNELHKSEHGVNARIAVALTRVVGSMQTAYTFAVLAIVGLFAILGWLSPIVALLVAWTSQTLIQLVLLPVIMVGQNVLGRHQELQADEAFATTIKSYHDAEIIIKQNNDLIAQTAAIIEKLEKIAIIAAQNDAIFAQNDRILDLVQKPKTTTTRKKEPV